MLDDITVDRPAPGIAVIHLPAQFDAYTFTRVREIHVELVREGVYLQVFDLTDVDLIDSNGLGVLVGAKKRLAMHDGTIVLDSPNASIRHVLNVVTGIGKIFHQVETVIVGSEA